ncbi:putative intracellular protease/amidase [Photobacterium leiognathi lrivu.4.1]|uniref:Putative intracellular protease/amidase n=1 Tax=Photobacterium leiognathi lrivu.4.1 TaxID=1248232 RepID=V5H391_PHOLE|nr:DJ-1/PfpI family protein [Photobacterium leiognathi]GAD31547.1 putative intracellular protease/amidase [Photobacterium leiognathi lrivu.4.1]
MNTPQTVTLFLFDRFQLLDAFGPLQMFSLLPEFYTLQTISQTGITVTSQQQIQIEPQFSFNDKFQSDILIIPGGAGLQAIIHDPLTLFWLKRFAPKQTLICSVCTGAALLATAGLLNYRRATTNKKQFHWVQKLGHNVEWQSSARWVRDSNIFTASGGSSGIDMALAVIGYQLGDSVARKVAIEAEYLWQNDPDDDPFAPLHIVR